MAPATKACLALLGLALLSGCGRAPSPTIDWALPTGGGAAAAGGASGQLSQPLGGVPVGGAMANRSRGPTGVDPCLGLGACAAADSLKVSAVTSRKAGFLWRKLEAKGTASNPSARPIRAVAWARFKQEGEVVEVLTKPLGMVGAGASVALAFTSTKAADSVELFALVEGATPPAAKPPVTVPSQTTAP